MNLKKIEMNLVRYAMPIILALMFYLVFDMKLAGKLVRSPFYFRGYILFVVLYAMMFHIFAQLYGGYQIGHRQSSDIVLSNNLALLFTNGFMYIVSSLIVREMLNLPVYLALTLSQTLVIWVWSKLMNRLYIHLFGQRKLLMIYEGMPDNIFEHKLNTISTKYALSERASISEGVDNLLVRLSDYDGVIIDQLQENDRNRIACYCYENNIRLFMRPTLMDIIVRGGEMLTLVDTPLVLYRNDFSFELLKRLFDILVSSVALLLVSPIMLITALAIKLYDGGPVFYKQQRCSVGGKVFEVLKFRSMIVDAEKDGKAVLAKKHDDRITPIGKFIRKVRIDELPQILNILNGDMSVVGPRPERPEIIAQLKQEIPQFDYRLKVKAGLTGYAQVVGKYNTEFLDKLKLDLIYIQNRSLLFDLRIILVTFKILLSIEATEGVSEKSE